MTETRSLGFVLPLVMIWVAMLALLAAELTSTARVQLRLAAAMRDAAISEAAADGAIRHMMYGLRYVRRPPTRDAVATLRIGEAVVTVAIEDESEKINPNRADFGRLRDLMVQLGIAPHLARLLAGEIVDWRTRNPESVLGGHKLARYQAGGLPYRTADRAFNSVTELRQMPEMTREIFALLRPFLFVYHTGPAPAADMTASAATPAPDHQSQVLRITAVAVVGDRARFVRSAVVRLRVTAGDNRDPPRVLTWE